MILEKDIGQGEMKSPIYLNQYSSRHNKQLLSARMRKKEITGLEIRMDGRRNDVYMEGRGKRGHADSKSR